MEVSLTCQRELFLWARSHINPPPVDMEYLSTHPELLCGLMNRLSGLKVESRDINVHPVFLSLSEAYKKQFSYASLRNNTNSLSRLLKALFVHFILRRIGSNKDEITFVLNLWKIAVIGMFRGYTMEDVVGSAHVDDDIGIYLRYVCSENKIPYIFEVSDMSKDSLLRQCALCYVYTHPTLDTKPLDFQTIKALVEAIDLHLFLIREREKYIRLVSRFISSMKLIEEKVCTENLVKALLSEPQNFPSMYTVSSKRVSKYLLTARKFIARRHDRLLTLYTKYNKSFQLFDFEYSSEGLNDRVESLFSLMIERRRFLDDQIQEIIEKYDGKCSLILNKIKNVKEFFSCLDASQQIEWMHEIHENIREAQKLEMLVSVYRQNKSQCADLLNKTIQIGKLMKDSVEQTESYESLRLSLNLSIPMFRDMIERFEDCDKDKSGYLQEDELCKALSEYELLDRDISKFFQRYKSGHGVSFNEYAVIVSRLNTKRCSNDSSRSLNNGRKPLFLNSYLHL